MRVEERMIDHKKGPRKFSASISAGSGTNRCYIKCPSGNVNRLVFVEDAFGPLRWEEIREIKEKMAWLPVSERRVKPSPPTVAQLNQDDWVRVPGAVTVVIERRTLTF